MNELKMLGKVTIARKDFDGRPSYSIGFSEKNKDDGTWINSYMPVTFRKGVEMEDKTNINITDSFMKPYKGKTVSGTKIIVMAFEKLENESGFAEVDASECPF